RRVGAAAPRHVPPEHGVRGLHGRGREGHGEARRRAGRRGDRQHRGRGDACEGQDALHGRHVTGGRSFSHVAWMTMRCEAEPLGWHEVSVRTLFGLVSSMTWRLSLSTTNGMPRPATVIAFGATL